MLIFENVDWALYRKPVATPPAGATLSWEDDDFALYRKP